MNIAKVLGSYWVQSGTILWSQVEGFEGERNWNSLSNYEKGIINAAANGLIPIVTIGSAPDWAQKIPGYSCGPILQEKYNAFGNFLFDLVDRYHRPPYSIKYWQIWNEPDADHNLVPPDSPFGCWGDPADKYYGGAFYGEMLKAVYPRIKAADPDAVVIIGGLLSDCDPINPPETQKGTGVLKDCTNSKFMEGILATGAAASFDAINYHSYDYYYGDLGKFGNPNWNNRWDTNGVLLLPKTQYFRGLLAKYGYPDKKLINTETAVICGSSGDEPQCQTEQYELTKAYYVAQTFAIAISEGLEANLWYSLTGWRGSGLVDKSLAPLPSYYAYTFSASKLQNVSFSKKILDYPGVSAYEFYGRDRPIWMLWSQDGNEHSITLETYPTAAYDVLGNSLQIRREYTLSVAPLYLEW